MKHEPRLWDNISTGGGCDALSMTCQDTVLGFGKGYILLLTDEAQVPEPGVSECTMSVRDHEGVSVCFFCVLVDVSYEDEKARDGARVTILEFI